MTAPKDPQPAPGGKEDKVLHVTGYLDSFVFEGYEITKDGTVVPGSDVDKVKQSAKYNGVTLRETKVKE